MLVDDVRVTTMCKNKVWLQGCKTPSLETRCLKIPQKVSFCKNEPFSRQWLTQIVKKIMRLFWGIFKYCAEVSSLCHRGHFDIDSTLSILLDPRKFLHKPTFFSIAKIDDLLDFWAAKKVEKTEIEQDGRTKDKPLRPSANFFYCLDLYGIYLLVPSI